MGLFGFGKKKRQSEEAAEAAAEENDKADEAISETAEAPAGGIQETILPEPSDEYDGRGDEHGPWDVDDENVPDYDEYLDMGAYYLPFLQGIELRVKANRATQQVLGTTITYGSSSVEIEAFAAPKTMGLWDDVRADLVEANKDAKETDGVFGTEKGTPGLKQEHDMYSLFVEDNWKVSAPLMEELPVPALRSDMPALRVLRAASGSMPATRHSTRAPAPRC